jgi:hypothetical protein
MPDGPLFSYVNLWSTLQFTHEEPSVTPLLVRTLTVCRLRRASSYTVEKVECG